VSEKQESPQSSEGKNLGCSQCGKPWIAGINSITLCVDCFYKLRCAETLGFRIAAISYNRAAEEMDALVPIGPPTAKMQVPDMPKGPMIFNNIHVKDSTVGAINTGEVHDIDVNITHLKNSCNRSISNALTNLTQSINE
jgi:hypothetical protein